MSVLLGCISVLPHVCSTYRSQKRVGSLGTGVVNSYERPCRCQESNLGPLEEQPVHITAKSSLQPPQEMFKKLKKKSSNLVAQWPCGVDGGGALCCPDNGAGSGGPGLVYTFRAFSCHSRQGLGSTQGKLQGETAREGDYQVRRLQKQVFAGVKLRQLMGLHNFQKRRSQSWRLMWRSDRLPGSQGLHLGPLDKIWGMQKLTEHIQEVRVLTQVTIGSRRTTAPPAISLQE